MLLQSELILILHLVAISLQKLSLKRLLCSFSLTDTAMHKLTLSAFENQRSTHSVSYQELETISRIEGKPRQSAGLSACRCIGCAKLRCCFSESGSAHTGGAGGRRLDTGLRTGTTSLDLPSLLASHPSKTRRVVLIVIIGVFCSFCFVVSIANIPGLQIV